MKQKQPEGALAAESYNRAKELVKRGLFDEALSVDLRIGDRWLIDKQIREARAKEPAQR